jgi:hypothetical protein
MAKHADCIHLMQSVLYPREFNIIKRKHRKEMLKFSELGVRYTPTDGKKRFQGKQVRMSSLVNYEIEIHDFERDVKTQFGESRYLVSFRDPIRDEWGKFFVNSEEMKQVLESVSQLPNGLPFLATIKCEAFGNGRGSRYFFT